MYLETRPVWSTPNRQLTVEEIRVTNKLYQIFQRVTTQKQLLSRQVRNVKAHQGTSHISTCTGNVIDRMFKEHVRAAKTRGELPPSLQVTERFKKYPDVWLDRVAWDITTAEQGKYHVSCAFLATPIVGNFHFCPGVLSQAEARQVA